MGLGGNKDEVKGGNGDNGHFKRGEWEIEWILR
jgi:hypothetical protein